MRLLDRPYLLLVLTSLFWAGNTIVGRGAVDLIAPATLSCLRWTIALAILLPFAWPHVRRDWPAIRRSAAVLFGFALTGSGGYTLIAYLALHYTTAINSLLLQSVSPLFVALWTFALFGERLRLIQAAGIATSLVGVLLIIGRGDPGVLARLAFNVGDLMILVALVFYSLYTALVPVRPAMHPLSFLTGNVAASAALALPVVGVELATGHVPVLDVRTVASFVYVGIFPSVVAYFFLNRAIELIGANRAAPFIHLMPVFGSILAILFLGEAPQWFHAMGYVLVLIGVLLAARE